MDFPLKIPRPKTGPDCLLCAVFARQRLRRGGGPRPSRESARERERGGAREGGREGGREGERERERESERERERESYQPPSPHCLPSNRR